MKFLSSPYGLPSIIYLNPMNGSSSFYSATCPIDKMIQNFKPFYFTPEHKLIKYSCVLISNWRLRL